MSEGKCVSPIVGLETRSWALSGGELGLIKSLQKPGVLKICTLNEKMDQNNPSGKESCYEKLFVPALAGNGGMKKSLS